jgi:hypothetical protein
MSRRLVRHPGVIIAALAAATVVGAFSVGSMVQVFVVGTSRLGLDSPAGVALSAVCAALATATIVGLMFVVMRGGGGHDDDDWRHGDDDVPPPPAPDGPYGEPEWWRDFEHEFSTYVREPSHTRRGDETPATVR